jgi:hypothetical protein
MDWLEQDCDLFKSPELKYSLLSRLSRLIFEESLFEIARRFTRLSMLVACNKDTGHNAKHKKSKLIFRGRFIRIPAVSP